MRIGGSKFDGIFACGKNDNSVIGFYWTYPMKQESLKALHLQTIVRGPFGFGFHRVIQHFHLVEQKRKHFVRNGLSLGDFSCVYGCE